jgi:hypothetical protein
MSTSVIGLPIFGLEPIQRAAFYQLFQGLNGALAQMALFMDHSDQEIATLTGRDYLPTVLEPENFYEGHRPSLINAPIGNYPNCSVMANQATPAALDLVDQADAYRCNLFVEVMAKTTNGEESGYSEDSVNRRVQRMAEAVNLTLMADQSLGGVVTAFDGPPIVIVGDVFVRKEKTSYGAEWLWQGARLEYAVRKDALRPSSSGAVLPAFDIDQA